MSKRVIIKCQQCGNWKKIKVMNGEKRKKVCNNCLGMKYKEEDIII